MTKAEFLKALRERLEGEVPDAEIRHTLQYYEEYIFDAVRAGKTESQVLDELGSPLLIAKTIIDTSAMEEESGRQQTFEEGPKPEKEPGVRYHSFNLNSWTAKLTLILVMLVFFGLFFTILRVLVPILLPLLMIWLIVAMIRNGGRR